MQRNDAVNNAGYSQIALRTGLKSLYELAKIEILLALMEMAVAIGGLCMSKPHFRHMFYHSDGIFYYNRNGYVIAFSFGLIAAVFGYIGGAVGVKALVGHDGATSATITSVRHQRLAVARFVMCILVAIIDFIEFIVFLIPPTSDDFHDLAIPKTMVPVSCILSAFFLAHSICSIVSCGILCNNWCRPVATVEQRTEEKKPIIAFV